MDLDSMNQAAVNRFDDAIAIQAGACNPSGIARALVRAINQCRDESVQARGDPAVRLIVHQLAFLCKVDEINTGFSTYHELTLACEAHCPPKVPSIPPTPAAGATA
jgi:hypothetical protein